MHKQVQGTIHKTLIKKGSEASWIHYSTFDAHLISSNFGREIEEVRSRNIGKWTEIYNWLDL